VAARQIVESKVPEETCSRNRLCSRIESIRNEAATFFYSPNAKNYVGQNLSVAYKGLLYASAAVKLNLDSDAIRSLDWSHLKTEYWKAVLAPP
jgi:hypothetical protein